MVESSERVQSPARSLLARLLVLVLTAAMIATACTPDPETASSDDGDTESSAPETRTADTASTVAPEADGTLNFKGPTVDNSPLDISEDIRVGVLDNGLTYYVRSNNSPGGSVSMRLVVNAGGIDEDPLGTGAAHFLEHMMFNGTEKYPGNSLDAALRRIGAEIGPDFNAYTSDSETVYQIEVADRGDNVATAFDVLAQWASAATIDPAQVVAEAPVVREELRLRDESGDGLINVAFEQAYYAETPFEGVNVSGTADTVNALTHVELRDFYDTWYRPDNMAIIAVGDRSLDELEDEIKEHFSSLQPRGESKDSPDTAKFALRTKPLVETVIEPSFGDSYVSLDIPIRAWDLGTVGGTELHLTEVVLGLMIDSRLVEGVDSGRLNLRRGRGGRFQWNRDLAYFGFNIDADDLEAGTEVLMTEIRGSVQNRFTQSELDRAVAAVQDSQDQRLAQYGTKQDRDFANEMVGHYLDGGDLQSIDASYDMATDILQNLDLDAVNDHYGWLMESSAPIVLVVGPDAERVGTVDGHLAALDRASQAVVAAFDDDVEEIDSLLESRPEPVAELERKRLDVNPGVELVFDNGIRVFFSPSNISEKQVNIVTESPGGRSQLSEADGPVAPAAIAAVSASGVGEWNPIQVRRYLSDREVSLTPYIADFSEGFSGAAATRDIDTLFALLHLSILEPRVDPVPFSQQVEFARDRVERVGLDSATASQVALSDARTGGGALAAAPTLAQLNDLTEEDVQRIWDERFGALDDHVIVIVGDVEEQTIIELSRTYLGSLPQVSTSDSPEQPPAPGIVTERLAVGSGTSGGSYRLLYVADQNGDAIATRVLAEVTERILRDRLFTVVREELGATYGGSAIIEFSEPGDQVELLISIDGDPGRIDEIAETVTNELESLRNGSVSEADFTEAIAVLESEYGFINNGYIIGSLFDEAYRPPNQVLGRQAEYDALLRVRRGDVVELLSTLTKTDSIIDVRNVPAG